jgi:hypothetical protein
MARPDGRDTHLKDDPPMHLESTPDEAPGPKPKRPVSARQVAANQRNALLSTGPRTAEGKENSRKNALKHGLCALVLDVPGEDPDVFDTRLQDWNAESLSRKGCQAALR